MAHLIETMAYTGDTPWHLLGHQLPPKQPIEVWAQTAGMDWTIRETPVRYMTEDLDAPEAIQPLQTLETFPEQKVLYRSDTRAPLSVVSNRYQVVQPRAVLEFYRDLTEIGGYEMETAGVLKAGRKFWALARTGKQAVFKGSDVVNGYLLLATSCDGTLATTVTPTTVRVVCNNTLSIALDGTSNAIRVPHNTRFNADAIKRQLGIAVSQWDSFMYRMKALSERKVKSKEASDYFLQVLCGLHAGEAVRLKRSAEQPSLPHDRALKKVLALFEGQGRGAELAAAKGTAWGLLSAMTEFVDHERRARSREYRLDSAWFGQGAALKQRALDHALQLMS
jgi:phage/plasmid-like protein (TIGR03299 family)